MNLKTKILKKKKKKKKKKRYILMVIPVKGSLTYKEV